MREIAVEIHLGESEERIGILVTSRLLQQLHSLGEGLLQLSRLRCAREQVLWRRGVHEEENEYLFGVVCARSQYAGLLVKVVPWRRGRLHLVKKSHGLVERYLSLMRVCAAVGIPPS